MKYPLALAGSMALTLTACAEQVDFPVRGYEDTAEQFQLNVALDCPKNPDSGSPTIGKTEHGNKLTECVDKNNDGVVDILKIRYTTSKDAISCLDSKGKRERSTRCFH